MSYRTLSTRVFSVARIRHAAKRTLLLSAAMVSVFSILSTAAIGAAPAALKQAPVAPTTDSVGVTAPVTKKEAAKSVETQALLAWTAGLSATSTNLWPTQYTTLTASTNQDVGPTPYYLSIYDVTTNSYIKICGAGTTCSISITHGTATTHTYRAYVSSYPIANPPANQQAVSGNVAVTWKGVSVSLATNVSTTFVNGTATLTATASADVGPSPFYIQIFDTTTGARVTYCGFGTTCTGYVTQGATTTHRYAAYVSNYDLSLPLTNQQAISGPAFVSWNTNGYRVSLGITSNGGSSRTVKATTNVNVGPTPYYIQIFNLRTGTRVAICGTGTTCSTTLSVGIGRTEFAAFISSSSTSLPPLNTQASSKVTGTFYLPIFPLP